MTAIQTRIQDYIREQLPKTVHLPDAGNDLPEPYSTPCVKEDFLFFFYWDTYFTNLGFYHIGMAEQARSNLLNMAYLIDKYGFMPNATPLTDRSQPPLFVRGVYDYWKISKEDGFVVQMLPAMLREYTFWMEKRMTSCGLNRYLGRDTPHLVDFNREMCARLKLGDGQEAEKGGYNFLAVAESGWDFSSRFFENGTCMAASVCEIDLNAILYDVEQKLALFLEICERKEDAERMRMAAEKRARLMRRLMYDSKRGVYFDYNFTEGRRGNRVTAASLVPWAMGIPCNTCGFGDVLRALETPYGLLTTEYLGDERYYQWDYPMMWPPLAYFGAYAALEAGEKAAAARLMKKYCSTVEKVFEDAGKLWEKYDVVHCRVGGNVEYSTPPMMGWTAGVYLYFSDLLNYQRRF